jgi:hypothetical protein
MDRTVIILTKIPITGAVKTRLQPFLSPEECAELAAAFVQDTSSKAYGIGHKTIVAASPFDKRNELENILTTEQFYIEQIGNDLGEKMYNAFRFAFRHNSNRVVMIGTDSPTFPRDYIELAFENLEKTDAVLGETTDGGFYLIGLRELHKNIFENIEWSTPRAFEQTKRNIIGLNFNLRQIPAWYDVDEAEDLFRLFNEFQTDEHAKKTAPATYKWLTNHKKFSKPND